MWSSSRWLRSVVCAAACLAATGMAWAYPGAATDAAFAALLTMPGAQPKEGGWVIPEQAFPTPTSEDELITRLQTAQKAGAQWGAMRHGGTLLAHAIRAGKERAAIWLLRHGAQPRQILARDDTITAYDLARRYQRVQVLHVLERSYGFKPPKDAGPKTAPAKVQAHAKTPAPATTVVSASPSTASLSRPEQARALLREIAAMGVYRQEAPQKWQRFAATLNDEEFAKIFEDGIYLSYLIHLSREAIGSVEQALARLPQGLVRSHAQMIAGALAEWSRVEYSESKISYTPLSQSWPALWSRIDRPLDYSTARAIDPASRLTVQDIPPAMWPDLFASGYPKGSIKETGCLLGAMDAEAFKTLWPQLVHWFADAQQETPGLVLTKYRLSHERSPCHYSSSAADTVAKLAYLQRQGVTSPVTGLRPSLLQEAEDASLLVMANQFAAPAGAHAPRLVRELLTCTLSLGEPWLNALIQHQRDQREGVVVQALSIPGQASCALGLGGGDSGGWPPFEDHFFDGPSRLGSRNCSTANLSEGGAIWIEDGDHVRSIKVAAYGVWPLRSVSDAHTQRRYLLTQGIGGFRCELVSLLPMAYEWQPNSLQLKPVTGSDAALLDTLLRAQCREIPDAPQGDDIVCEGIDESPMHLAKGEIKLAIPALQSGGGVEISSLIDALGADRRAAYRAAVAAHDRAQLRQLLVAGIPAWWTTAEISALATADIPLEEKRRRIAMLFAEAGQLDRAIHADHGLPDALLTWLPDEDWGPVLRAMERDPGPWLGEYARRLREAAQDAGRVNLACRIDHALGFLCGGGLIPD